MHRQVIPPTATLGQVLAVATDSQHRFSKSLQSSIELIPGEGVRGDAHRGQKVQHRSRVRVNPDQPNLRQVHLISSQTLDDLCDQGFSVGPGILGENITTHGLDLLSMPLGTRLLIGNEVILSLTGLRNPCQQLNDFQPGLMQALIGQDSAGNILLLAGVMAVVDTGGWVAPGDEIRVEYPLQPWSALQRV